MLFSVVVAVRNEKENIKKCLEGIFSQDIKEEFEVIIADGMSADGSYEILKNLQKQYKFTLIKNEKINAAAGRNLGIKKAKGKYVAFIDADAIPSKDWLSQIKKVFSEEKEEIVGAGGPDKLPEDSTEKAKIIGYIMTSPIARGGKINPSTQHSLMDEERFAEHIPTCNLCLKKQVFEDVGLFDEKFVKGQDLELNYRITKAGFKLLYSPKIQVVHYRKSHIRSFVKQIYKWAKAKVAIIKKHGFDGLLSHIYLWPAYALAVLAGSIVIFSLIGLWILFTLIFISGISYISIICVEAGNLTKKFNDKKLISYGLLLLPLVHISYFLGVLVAILKRNIW
jgi:GT2 family glycosyltransferase